MKKVLISEVAKQIEKLKLTATSEPIEVINEGGDPVAILSNPDQFRAMQVVLNLANDPKHLSEILEAHERFQSGNLDGTEEMILEKV